MCWLAGTRAHVGVGTRAHATHSLRAHRYMGVHSPADVVVGVGLGALGLLGAVGYGAAADAFILHSPSAVPVMVAVVIVAAAVYPRPRPWTSSPGDTVVGAPSPPPPLASCRAHACPPPPRSLAQC